MPGHTSVPQVDRPPNSPALHWNMGVDESDQDIMITGYHQPTKPMTKVLLSEIPPLLATLPLQVTGEMMYKGTVCILCPNIVL